MKDRIARFRDLKPLPIQRPDIALEHFDEALDLDDGIVHRCILRLYTSTCLLRSKR